MSLATEPKLTSRGSAATQSDSVARVIVIGGGLAGMAAAVVLESAGCDVTLLEARKTLGGRAGSFTDPQTGEELDNCQHVLLGCCTHLLDFYKRVGATDAVRFYRTIRFMDPAGKAYDLFGVGMLPAPLHLGPSMLRFNALSIRERVSVSLAMLAMLRLGKAGREKLADVSFGQWLDEHRQPASLLGKFYDPVLVGALNEQSRNASAMYAIQVFQDAMLAHGAGYLVGVPDVPLTQLYGRLPCRDVRTGVRVSELKFAGRTVTGVELTDGQVLTADAVVIATGHHTARRFVPDELAACDKRFAQMEGLEDVPILGVHLWFDRPVLNDPFVALIAGPLQWLFRKNADGSAIHGVISAARDWVGKPKEQCLAEFERQVRETLPLAREAKLTRGTVVVEKRATFAPTPGSDRYRPSQAPLIDGIGNLYLAGDYTTTGWPATMEGAVRSGYRAAEAVMAASGRATRFQVGELPVQWPARWLGL